ncbi:MAG: septum formation family protein [Acidimicrobiales bacterium]|nr:septum formation family protein [Acidimicrobiales bacterium]
MIDQCQRLGIDAKWAGAELSVADVDLLQAELAAVGPDAAVVPGAAVDTLPPTAVGSRPDLVDELTPDVAAGDPVPGRRGYAGEAASDTEASTAANAPSEPPARRFDRGTRHGAIWLVLAAALLGLSLGVRSPWMVWTLWAAGAVALGFTILDANRGRRQASLHPERVRGLWASVLILLGGVAMAVALLAAVVAVVRSDPAEDMPVVGELDAVASARWGFHRVALVSGHGWRAPVKSVGTCWRIESGDDERLAERVEVGEAKADCDGPHHIEVLSVFALERDVDAPYPGLEGFVAASGEQCADALAAIDAAGTGTLVLEYPTEQGWRDADHDVTCAVRFGELQRGVLGD